MILEVRVNNYLAYNKEIKLNLEANMHEKRFKDNVYTDNDKKVNIVKSLSIFGPNNSGKTCLIRALNSLRNIMLGKSAEVSPNIFNSSKVCSLGVTFLNKDKVYSYDLSFDGTKENGRSRGFIYECFKEIKYDEYHNKKEITIFYKDVNKGVYKFCGNEELSLLIGASSNENIIIYLVNADKYEPIKNIKNIFNDFATSLVLIDTNNIPINKTISVLKNNYPYKDLVVSLIKEADLEIDDFKYVNNFKNIIGEEKPYEEVLSYVSSEDMYKLTSVHKGKSVPSLIFDSKGTKEIVALSSYIIEALIEGKTLVIDEIDNGLHYRITRSIIAMFNNVKNKDGQLIFTSHDISLLDTKRLFRKDQIAFIDKDKNGPYLYSLNDFTYREKGVRGDSDIAKLYFEGALGGVSTPDFSDTIIEIAKRRENNSTF